MNGYEVEFEVWNIGCSRKTGNASTLLLFFYGFWFPLKRSTAKERRKIPRFHGRLLLL
jgi:hypothetical protein